MHNNLLIIAEGEEDDYKIEGLSKNSCIHQINKWLLKRDQELPLVHLKNSYKKGIFNRTKVFTMDIYAGAYKCVFGEDFENLLKKLKWYLPDTVVVIYSVDDLGINKIFRPNKNSINKL